MHPKGKRLLDRVAIVTGGARGIGKAIALRYTREGAAVVIADRKAEEAAATVAEIEAHGGRAMFVHTDVTANASIENMVNETLRRYDRIDILVNNAGVALMRAFCKIPKTARIRGRAGWQRLIQQGQAGSLRNIMGSPKQT